MHDSNRVSLSESTLESRTLLDSDSLSLREAESETRWANFVSTGEARGIISSPYVQQPFLIEM